MQTQAKKSEEPKKYNELKQALELAEEKVRRVIPGMKKKKEVKPDVNLSQKLASSMPQKFLENGQEKLDNKSNSSNMSSKIGVSGIHEDRTFSRDNKLP